LLTINIESVSADGADLLPIAHLLVCVCVSQSVCLSGKCTVTEDMIGSGMVSGVGQWVGVLDRGELGASHSHQWELSCIVVHKQLALPTWLWGGLVTFSFKT